MITSSIPNTWQNFQEEAARILKECGFAVELEKTIKTARGKVEVDVYAEEYVNGRKYSILCECKHWKSPLPQNVIHSFRTVVSDSGSNAGYIISLNGFQKGSFKASELTNLELLTWQEFQQKFEESWYNEYFSPTIAKKLDPLLTYVEPILPKWFPGLPDKDKEEYIDLKEKYDEFGWLIMKFTPYVRIFDKKSTPISTLPVVKDIPVDSSILKNVPKKIIHEKGYREFLNYSISFGEQIITKFRRIRDRNTP